MCSSAPPTPPTHLNEALVLSDQKDQVVLKVPPGTQNQLVLLVHQKKEFPILPSWLNDFTKQER